MESVDFFKDEKFNSQFKNKTGIYVIEQPVFTKYVGFPVYKIGFARNSLYTRVRDYKTAYGLVPFKIHLLYLIPQKVQNKRVLYTYLTERIIQQTLKNYEFWTGTGEWFKELNIIMSVVYEVRAKHLRDIPKSQNWLFWTYNKDTLKPVKKMKLVSEEEISGTFKNIVAKRHTRSGENEDPDEDYEFEEINSRNVARKTGASKKKLVIPKSFVNIEGIEEYFE
jgi:hypothetical protein